MSAVDSQSGLMWSCQRIMPTSEMRSNGVSPCSSGRHAMRRQRSCWNATARWPRAANAPRFAAAIAGDSGRNVGAYSHEIISSAVTSSRPSDGSTAARQDTASGALRIVGLSHGIIA